MPNMAILSTALLITASAAAAQTACPKDTARITGQVLDPTGAVVVAADITTSPVTTALQTDRDGRFATACVPFGHYELNITAASFEPSARTLQLGAAEHSLTIRLKPETVQAEVNAVVDSTPVSSEDIAGSRTLEKSDIAQLADDPDEFNRQLQVLAAAAGGSPGQAITTVDGFQNSGRIPPKSAIAFIRVNPDLFSAEYARPPYQGGRIEIYTKPGQSTWHGALFTTQSAGFMNAKDPFAPSRAAIGKQRYGFELSGPIVKNRSDISLNLEHRQIDRFSVVNAITLDPAGNQTPVIANVATPESLWEASAHFGLQVSAKDNLTLAYVAGVNGLTNQGVGGDVLEEAGYNSVQQEHALLLTNLQTLSPTLVHETRLGYTWKYRADAPNSTAPSLQVAGAFTGGGAITGHLQAHERDLEFDDDILYSHGKHSLKAGLQLLDTSLHNSSPAGFNGTYIFGGNGNLTGIEQYRLALLNQPGGRPTQFNVTAGTPHISLNQLQAVLYAQDQWKFRPRLQFALGLRWALQNAPLTVSNLGPRLGVSWSPDRKQKTVFHARTGLFFGTVDPQTVLSNLQLNGINQRQLQIYNPVYGNPLTTGTSTITTLRTALPNLTQQPSIESHLGVEHEFPRHWHAQANLYLVHGWDLLRSRNINAPENGSPTGPRPIEPDTNLDQFQQTGHLGGNVLFTGIDQRSLKHLQLFAGYIRMDLRGDTDGASSFPQSTYSDRGEVSRLSWEATHQIIAFSNFVLPRKVNLSTQFNAGSGLPYNVLTGFDGNGDGVLNDRPVFSTPGSPATVYPTQFGDLSTYGPGGPIARNAGTLPWNVHLDANLSRTFPLPHKPGKEAQNLAINLRSTNLLNHTNVLAVGNVLGSPQFGRAYQADAGRRVEAGLRWSF